MAVTVAVLALPAVGGVGSWLVPRWRAAIGLAAAVATLLAALTLAREVLTGGARTVTFAATDGLAVVLVVDGLAATMVVLSSTVLLAAGTVAHRRRALADVHPAHFWPLAALLLVALHGLVLAGDLLTAYLLLELVAVAGALLVVTGGGRTRLAAGVRYLYAELVASVTFLAGTALVWSSAGTLVIAELPGTITDPTGRLGVALLTVGLLLKVPVVPLHFWLPAAHTLAPTAVSPLLSALVVKSAFVVLLRLWVTGVPELATAALAQLLGLLGAVAIIWGSLGALREVQVKRVVAYSTTAQLGLLLLAVPMIMAGSQEAWLGAVTHAVAHALPKAAVLIAVVVLADQLGGGTVDRLRGAVAARPVATFAVGVAGLSLIGLPPSGGFVAKWYLVVASISTGQWWWAVVIVVGSLLTAAYLARLLQRCFATSPEPALPSTAGGRTSEVVAFALALAGLLLGLYPDLPLTLLQVGAPLGVIAYG